MALSTPLRSVWSDYIPFWIPNNIVAPIRPQRQRHYFHRDSLPDPATAPIVRLLDAEDDLAYVHSMYVTVYGFKVLLRVCGRFLPQEQPGPGRPRLLTPRLVLAITLVWFNNPCPQKTLSLLTGWTEGPVNEAIDNGIYALVMGLPLILEARVEFPTLPQMLYLASVAQKFAGPDLPPAWGAVDGLLLRMFKPKELEEQKLYYSGYGRGFFAKSVFCVQADGAIAWCSTNCVGSWGDSRCALPLYAKLITTTEPGLGIVGDAAFRATGIMKDRLWKASTLRDELFQCRHYNRDEIAKIRARDRAVTKFRQYSEWVMRQLQGMFGRLRMKLPTTRKRRADIFAVVPQLYNFCLRTGSPNQLRSVFRNTVNGVPPPPPRNLPNGHWVYKKKRRLERGIDYHGPIEVVD